MNISQAKDEQDIYNQDTSVLEEIRALSIGEKETLRTRSKKTMVGSRDST